MLVGDRDLLEYGTLKDLIFEAMKIHHPDRPLTETLVIMEAISKMNKPVSFFLGDSEVTITKVETQHARNLYAWTSKCGVSQIPIANRIEYSERSNRNNKLLLLTI